MWKAKENILWFKQGDIVKEIQDNWEPHFEKIESKEKLEIESIEIVEELKIKEKVKQHKKRNKKR